MCAIMERFNWIFSLVFLTSFIEWTTNETFVESHGSIYVKFLDLLISIDQSVFISLS